MNILKSIEIVGLFLEALDLSLKKYWLVSSEVSLITTLLDPRFKKLTCFNETDKQKANTLLIKKYEKYIEENKIINIEENDGQTEENSDEFELNKSLIDSIFSNKKSDEEDENEVDIYFNFKTAKLSSNPLY